MTTLETVFLDRDGVINRTIRGDYVRTWEQFEFLPGVAEALAELTRAGLRLVVATNQRGVARGLMSAADLERIHARMRAELAARGAELAGVYACAHDEGACDCRKPRIGLFLQAQREHPAIDFAQSALVGDSPSDLEAANTIGCRAYLVARRDQVGAVREAAARGALRVDGTAESLPAVARRFLLPLAGAAPR